MVPAFDEGVLNISNKKVTGPATTKHEKHSLRNRASRFYVITGFCELGDYLGSWLATTTVLGRSCRMAQTRKENRRRLSSQLFHGHTGILDKIARVAVCQ